MEEMERIRKKILIKTLLCHSIWVIIIFSFVIFIPLNFTLRDSIDLIPIPVIIFGPMILIEFCRRLAKKINQKDYNELAIVYKKEMVLTSLKKLCDKVEIRPYGGIISSDIHDADMIKMGDIISSNDLVTGIYKGIHFSMSDLEIKKIHKGSDSDYIETTFKGQWFIFDFHKQFKSDIQICEMDFIAGKHVNWYKRGDRQYKKVELEDIQFNKTFEVIAKNEIDAFYILTPHVIEKIIEVNNKINGSLMFGFHNNKLHIALANNKDLFEPSIFKKNNMDKAMDEISIITNFVDILNLDNDLFKPIEGGGDE